MRDTARLARVHRVRTLQLGLARAEEVRAAAIAADEAMLVSRIEGLADAVAPSPGACGALFFAAAASYRERLHGSATTAQRRVVAARERAEQAAAASRDAQREQSAAEKLLARAATAEAEAERRRLQEAPPSRKRHGPC